MSEGRGFAATRALLTVVAVLLVPALLFAAVQLVAFDMAFYERQFEQLGIAQKTGVSPQELRQAMQLLLDYIKGDADSLVLTVTQKGEQRLAFDQKEQLHMEDVRGLYRGFLLLRNAAFVLLAAAIPAVWRQRERRAEVVAKGGGLGFAMVLGLLALLAVWALADFNSFWNAFHRLLFRNDLWLLDARVSLMINMLPLQLFFRLVFRVLALGLLLMACPLAAVLCCAVRCKRERDLV